MYWNKNSFLQETRRREKEKSKNEFTRSDYSIFSKYKKFMYDFVTGIDFILTLENSKYKIMHELHNNGFSLVKQSYHTNFVYFSLSMRKADKRIHIKTFFEPSEDILNLVRDNDVIIKYESFNKNNVFYAGEYRFYIKDCRLIFGNNQLSDFIFSLIADLEKIEEDTTLNNFYYQTYFSPGPVQMKSRRF